MDDNRNGIPDYLEGDTDGDGILDYLDNDDDGNGILDELERDWNGVCLGKRKIPCLGLVYYLIQCLIS